MDVVKLDNNVTYINTKYITMDVIKLDNNVTCISTIFFFY